DHRIWSHPQAVARAGGSDGHGDESGRGGAAALRDRAKRRRYGARGGDPAAGAAGAAGLGPRSTTRGMTGAPGASSSRPPTTTCSPAFTPFVTSTNPGVRTPSSTGRRLTFPSATTHTALAPSAGTTASSGMTIAFARTAVT